MNNIKSSSKSPKTSFIKGFTLIEMLVVIAIIAILTGIIVANLSGAKGKARDAKRVSDLGNIQLALELYFDRCNKYPNVSGGTVGQGGTSSDCNRTKPGTSNYYSMSDFIAVIPTPTNEAKQTYFDYSINAASTDYVLHAKLESSNAAALDGLDSTAYTKLGVTAPQAQGQSAGTLVTCNNTSGSTDFCLGPK